MQTLVASRTSRGKSRNRKARRGCGTRLRRDGVAGVIVRVEKGKEMPAERTEIVLATRNHGKIAEFRSLLKGLSMRLLSLYDFPNLPVVAEDGVTFRDNAEKKAKAIAKATGRLAIADDSGLEVDHLGGKPGVYSSRYCGEGATDKENTRRVLKLLDGVPWEERTARFVCVICAADSKGKTHFVEGACNGSISFEMRGSHGFGYDPIFVPESMTRTMAEIDLEEKNLISHRARALRNLRETLKVLGKKDR
jgi:XTP/dITP diphosphohydrolase